jgi:nucleotide-binding universal stress UspA family protein
MDIHDIVVGVDRSETTTAVLAAAIKMAERNGAKLHLVRAVPIPVEMPIEALSIDVQSLPSRLLAHAQGEIDQLKSKIPAEHLGSVEVRLGTPWQVLCDIAKERKVQVLLVGTHKYNMLDRLLGTTAARVANHAPCSVFIVREPSE